MKTQHFIAISALSIAIGIFLLRLFWPTPQLLVTPDFIRSDSWHIGISGKYLLKKSLNNNTLPLWTNKLNSGFPVLGEGQTGLFFIPNLLLFKFFDFTLANNLSYLFAFLTLGVGMYVWLLSLKFKPIFAWFGAMTVTFSGIVVPRMTHLAVLQGISFIPWVLWSVTNLYKKQTLLWVALTSMILSQQLLSGFTQSTVITVIFIFGYLIWHWFYNRRQFKLLILFLLVLLITCCLSAVHILPAQEYIKLTDAGSGLSLTDATRYSFPISNLPIFLNPFAFGSPHDGTYPDIRKFNESIFWENSSYIGIIPLLFIGILFFLFKKQPIDHKHLSIFFMLSIFTSFLLMLGKSSPLYLIYSFWPLNQFRVPSRFNWILVISLIALSTQSISWIEQKFRNKKILLLSLIILTLINTFWMHFLWQDYHLYSNAKEWLNPPDIFKNLNPTDRVTTLFSEEVYQNNFFKGWADGDSRFQFLKNTLAPNSNVIWGINSKDIACSRFLRRPSFIDNLMLANITLTDQKANLSTLSAKLLNLQAVDKIISMLPIESSQLKLLQQLRQNDLSIFLYDNPAALPRTYLTKQTILVKTLEEAEATIKTDAFIKGNSVLVEQPLNITKTGKSGTAEIIDDKDLYMKIQVKNNQDPSLLVLADTFYPGWEAAIDNKVTDIVPVNIRQKGVIVPDGDHEIIFKYHPKSFIIGAWISGISYLLLIMYLAFVYVKKLPRFIKKR